jgi:hypothetical protein
VKRFLAELGMTMPVISNPFHVLRVNSVRDPSVFEGVIHELSAAYRG